MCTWAGWKHCFGSTRRWHTYVHIHIYIYILYVYIYIYIASYLLPTAYLSARIIKHLRQAHWAGQLQWPHSAGASANGHSFRGSRPTDWGPPHSNTIWNRKRKWWIEIILKNVKIGHARHDIRILMWLIQFVIVILIILNRTTKSVVFLFYHVLSGRMRHLVAYCWNHQTDIERNKHVLMVDSRAALSSWPKR